MEPKLSQYLHAKGRKLGLPIAGTFELTSRCNFNCKMCYVHLTAEEQKKYGRELTAQEWIQLAQEAKEAGMVFLLLTGGEPTLRSDFPEIYSKLHEMGFIISINSNGYLLRGEILELFKRLPPTRINVSLYGTSNETYRNLCGVPAYEVILENIRALRENHIDVKMNMSVTDYNREDMQAVYEQAKALGVHTQAATYMFPPVRITGKFGEADRMTASCAAYCEVAYEKIRKTKEQYAEYRRRLLAGIPQEPGEDCEGQPGAEMPCRAGRSAFWLAWNGMLSPCGMMPQPAVNVLELGFRASWQRIRTEVENIRLPSACNTCRYRHGCHVCAAICYCETGRCDGKPEYLCELTKNVFELVQNDALGGNHGNQT